MQTKHIIRLEDYDYECGDGCCSEWGTRLYFNDELITEHAEHDFDEDLFRAIFKAIGHEVEIHQAESIETNRKR